MLRRHVPQQGGELRVWSRACSRANLCWCREGAGKGEDRERALRHQRPKPGCSRQAECSGALAWETWEMRYQEMEAGTRCWVQKLVVTWTGTIVVSRTEKIHKAVVLCVGRR